MTTTPSIACEPLATVAETTQVDTEFKASVRHSMRAIRRSIPLPLRLAHDAAIAANIEQWLSCQAISLLGVYWPIHCEPDLQALYIRLAGSGMRLALPGVAIPELPLTFFAWTPGEALVFSRGGIAAPEKTTVVIPQAMLLPCIAFNVGHYRIGYGGGYYDRTLAKFPQTIAIGVAYSFTEADFVATPHDIAMQIVITEKPLVIDQSI